MNVNSNKSRLKPDRPVQTRTLKPKYWPSSNIQMYTGYACYTFSPFPSFNLSNSSLIFPSTSPTPFFCFIFFLGSLYFSIFLLLFLYFLFFHFHLYFSCFSTFSCFFTTPISTPIYLISICLPFSILKAYPHPPYLVLPLSFSFLFLLILYFPSILTYLPFIFPLDDSTFPPGIFEWIKVVEESNCFDCIY